MAPARNHQDELSLLRSQVAALDQLMEVQDQAVITQSRRLEQALTDVRKHAQDLKQSEQALQEQRGVLQSILDSMSEGVVVADQEGRFLLFNPAAQQILAAGVLEIPPSEWATRYGVYQVDGGAPCPAEELPLVRALQGESAEDVRLLIRHVELRKKTWINVNARPLRDAEGSLRGGLAVFRDVTDHVRSQEQLARSNAELEQFAYVASHDLQEPLRTIRLYSELLRQRCRESLGTDATEFLDRIIASTDRLARLVRDLLAMSRVGRVSGSRKTIDCMEILDQVLQNLEGAIRAEGAVITRDPLPHAVGEPAAFTQLFQNLIANAIKFHGTRPPRIHVSGETIEAAVRFSVRDEGIGVDPSQAEMIFGMFKRLHGRSRYEGTGIGLALCRKIVANHGGRIWVESEEGKGATFFFTVPRERASTAGVECA
ncbi:MAG: ATP-binding protein [Acidobacteriota bacterium]